MPASNSPVIRSWELGLRLREYRERIDMTATAVSRKIGCTQGFVSAVELGQPKLTAARLVQLCKLYDVAPDEVDELEELRRGGNEKRWWHEYSGLFSAELQRFFGLEHGAEHIRSYHSELIYGLLQTEDYARAVVNAGYPYTRLTEVQRRVEARLHRQKRLTDPHPLQITSLVSQSSLMQHVGGAKVMHAQLQHLLRLADEHENVVIRVVPFTAGAHPGIGGPYQILSFESCRLHDLVWQEILTSTAIVDHPTKVTEFVVTFHEILKLSLSVDDSYDLIRAMAKEFT